MSSWRNSDKYYLIKACERGDVVNVRRLIKKTKKYESAVTAASKFGHPRIVKLLVNQGFEITLSAMEHACKNGHIEIIKYIVEKGFDIKSKIKYAVRAACKNGQVDVLKYLISLGADMDTFGDKGLETACAHGQLEIVKYLVKLGVDPGGKKGKYGWETEPMLWAINGEYIDVVGYLLDNGVKLGFDVDPDHSYSVYCYLVSRRNRLLRKYNLFLLLNKIIVKDITPRISAWYFHNKSL